MPPQIFESQYQWNLYGSAGRNSFAGDFLRCWKGSDGFDLILGKVEIASLWPDRTTDEHDFKNLRTDFTVSLPQIIFSRNALEELLSQLARWLKSRDPVCVDLCSEKNVKNQRLTVAIGPPRMPSTLGKGLLSVEYSGISFTHSKCDYVVDQSCVAIFLDELRAAMVRLDASSR
jgi:hypothetical protein